MFSAGCDVFGFAFAGAVCIDARASDAAGAGAARTPDVGDGGGFAIPDAGCAAGRGRMDSGGTGGGGGPIAARAALASTADGGRFPGSSSSRLQIH